MIYSYEDLKHLVTGDARNLDFDLTSGEYRAGHLLTC